MATGSEATLTVYCERGAHAVFSGISLQKIVAGLVNSNRAGSFGCVWVCRTEIRVGPESDWACPRCDRGDPLYAEDDEVVVPDDYHSGNPVVLGVPEWSPVFAGLIASIRRLLCRNQKSRVASRPYPARITLLRPQKEAESDD